MNTPKQSEEIMAQKCAPPVLDDIDEHLEEVTVDSCLLQQSLKKTIRNADVATTLRTVARKMSGLGQISIADLMDLAYRSQIKFVVDEDKWEDHDVTEFIDSILQNFSDAFFSKHPEFKDAPFEELRGEAENVLGERIDDSSDKAFFLSQHVISKLKNQYLPDLYRLFGVGVEFDEYK